jgi:hypothetical protein
MIVERGVVATGSFEVSSDEGKLIRVILTATAIRTTGCGYGLPEQDRQRRRTTVLGPESRKAPDADVGRKDRIGTPNPSLAPRVRSRAGPVGRALAVPIICIWLWTLWEAWTSPQRPDTLVMRPWVTPSDR